MDRRIAKLPPQDRSRFSSWILEFSDVFGGGGGGGGGTTTPTGQSKKRQL